MRWYARNRRTLPWREDPSPYRVWISEIMLQQTQVRTVLPYYERFMRRFPDIRSLASAAESEVLAHWAGLGYYARARNIRRAALVIEDRYSGDLPQTYEELVSLPGIGAYTAGAILSIAFNQPFPVVDGNVRRLIRRLQGMRTPPGEKLFWEIAAAWIPKGRAADFNQAVMELGALICTPARPRCPSCPVQAICEARRRCWECSIPEPRRRQPAEGIGLAILLLERNGRILLSSTPAADFIPGMWGLPAIQVEDQGSAEEAAQDLARRITGGSAMPADPFMIRHAITHRRIVAAVFRADCTEAPGKGTTARGYRWFERTDALRHITSSLYRKALRYRR
ncbi:MAG: A/G-specific adenine glycosylase [Acidobacteria bacterium]|nr:A/G-specific adenine glycosylase [Acidobacteriota bacterium]